MGLKDAVTDWHDRRFPTSKGALRRAAELASEQTQQDIPSSKALNKYLDERLQPTSEVEFGVILAQEIKSSIRAGVVHDYKGGTTFPFEDNASDDFQYPVDKIAEAVVKNYFEDAWRNGQNYGYVTEGQGLKLPPPELMGPSGKPDLIYLIDPVDGSRRIEAGAENGTVTMVGVPGNIENPTFSDIQFALTLPLKNTLVGDYYYTKRSTTQMKCFIEKVHIHTVIHYIKKH